MMKQRLATLLSLALSLALCLAFAQGALAEVKVYNSTPPGGEAGDQIQISSTLCPTTDTTPGMFTGSAALDDDGTGTVTIDDLSVVTQSNIVLDTTLFAGPGSFIFVDAMATTSPTPGQTGAGSTAKDTGTITWGVIGGWSSTGFTFCISSPTTICDNNVGVHGMTVFPSPQSPTYDMGTWTFDAEGDYEASPYIRRTSNGGSANTNWELRGTFVGAGIPMLPLVGLGALATGLAVVGARTLLRRR